VRAYYYIAKMKLLVSLTYRFDVFASFGTNLLIIISNIYLWKVAYNGIDSVAGINETQMISYAIVSGLLSSVFSTSVEVTIQEKIASGDIVIDFFRPTNLIAQYFSEDVGIAVSSLLSKMVPLIAVTLFLFNLALPVNFITFVLFIVSAGLSFIILWMISAIIGLLCFWFIQLGDFGAIKDGIVFLLSGRFIPLWLFPKGLQRVLAFLPFQYVYQTPLSIYIEQTMSEETYKAIFIQFVWVIILSLLLFLTWKKAKNKVQIQGG